MPNEMPSPTPPDPFTAALERATARSMSDSWQMTREFYGETFTFNWRSTTTTSSIEAIGHFQRLAAGDMSKMPVDETLRAVVDFLDSMATPETAEKIAALLRSGVVGIHELVEMQREVVERVSGRPTISSPSSPPG